jgi:hypothetical protein
VPQRYALSHVDAVEPTHSGALRLSATPTSVGVFSYTRPDGSIVRELRHPDDVFAAESLASLEDAPVTIKHPPKVTPTSYSTHSVGHVRAGTVRADAGAGVVRSGIVLARQDAVALAAAHGSKVQLSAGYDCQWLDTPGTWNGQAYDRRQVNIVYNHVAILPPGTPGRAGAVCRLDSAGIEVQDSDHTDAYPMKITIAGKAYENENEAQAAVDALAAQVTTVTARADAADARVIALTETVARHDAAQAAAEHTALAAKVKSIMGPAFAVARKDAAGVDVPLTARELRVAVIKRADAAFDDSARDDAYVCARYDATIAVSSKAAEIVAALNGPPTAPATGGTVDRADALYTEITAAAKAKGVQFTP